jgi:death-on-curing protein
VDEPRWVSKRAVLALHAEQLAEHGGSEGIRDESLLDSALAKPKNVFAYAESPDLSSLAASYAYGIARNRAFVDGNKRTALVISILFLNRNGWDIEASKTEVYDTFWRVAEGSMNEQELTAWFTSHAVPI